MTTHFTPGADWYDYRRPRTEDEARSSCIMATTHHLNHLACRWTPVAKEGEDNE